MEVASSSHIKKELQYMPLFFKTHLHLTSGASKKNYTNFFTQFHLHIHIINLNICTSLFYVENMKKRIKFGCSIKLKSIDVIILLEAILFQNLKNGFLMQSMMQKKKVNI